MPSPQDIERNLAAVANAIAQQRLEGLEPSSEVVADLRRAARGEITVNEVLANLGRRHGHEPQVFEP